MNYLKKYQMKKVMKIIGLTILSVMSIFGGSYLTSKSTLWSVVNNLNDKTAITWAKFEWTNDTLSGRFFERTCMFIPCKVEGISNVCTFQFDLGANYTGAYEKALSSFYEQNPALENKVKYTLNGRLQFWWSWKNFENFSMRFGDYTATNKMAYVYKNHGYKVKKINPSDTIHLGTVGADLFKDKVVIIDYPNKQFAICENIPKDYQNNLIDIEITKKGKIILPMIIHGKNYRIMFDNGSSIFPIITEAKNIANYTTSADIDTIKVSSWGKMHDVTGKIIKDTFELAGQKFSDVKAYTNHSGLGYDKSTDGITGNALFWDRTVVIDFKNKKFGVK